MRQRGTTAIEALTQRRVLAKLVEVKVTVSGAIVGQDGRVALSEETRQRYRLLPDTPIRVVETRGGILLVPLTGGPIGPELAAELSQWQALGAGSWDQFSCEPGTWWTSGKFTGCSSLLAQGGRKQDVVRLL